jgi:N-acyl-D-amino-acid deacylase
MTVRNSQRLILILSLLASAHAWAKDPPFDTVILNGHVIDGSGSPWYAADIGIRDGRIAAIGHLATARAHHRIDAHGQIVAPGFIDMLGQSEYTILVDPRLPSKIYQGITTEITGEGGSAAPVMGAARSDLQNDLSQFGLNLDWTDFRSYFARLERQGIGINIGSYVGATSVRKAVIGNTDRPPTPQELIRMQGLVRDAMRQGALGLSSSLEYAPAPYASTAELIALAKIAANEGGIYATHMRSEGDGMDSALDETFNIAREAQIPVEIWHLKIAGRSNWGRMPQIVAKIEEARRSGLDIGADTYAYTAWFNEMSAFVPPWAHDGGKERLLQRLGNPATRERIKTDMLKPSADWDNEWNEVSGPEGILIGVVHNPELKPLQGRTVQEIANERHADPLDTLLDILIADHASTECAVFGMNESDVALALKQPWTSVNNDSSGASTEGLLGSFHPHPRAFGTFPRILRKYVREEHLLSLEDAIRKFAALPASRMRITDRGLIKTGLWADLVIFDPASISDRATYDLPNQLSQGMDWVLVNGEAVVAQGQMTGRKPGKVLRGPAYRRTEHL